MSLEPVNTGFFYVWLNSGAPQPLDGSFIVRNAIRLFETTDPHVSGVLG